MLKEPFKGFVDLIKKEDPVIAGRYTCNAKKAPLGNHSGRIKLVNDSVVYPCQVVKVTAGYQQI